MRCSTGINPNQKGKADGDTRSSVRQKGETYEVSVQITVENEADIIRLMQTLPPEIFENVQQVLKNSPHFSPREFVNSHQCKNWPSHGENP